jgi:hypothetical protein
MGNPCMQAREDNGHYKATKPKTKPPKSVKPNHTGAPPATRAVAGGRQRTAGRGGTSTSSRVVQS